MGYDSFGLKIGIEGEREFKNSLREINQSFKVLGSEMNLVASEFDKNDKSIQAVTARNSVLNREIDAQKDKISTLEKALSNAAASFGENDKRTQAWVVQLNNAKAELNNMERELEESRDAVKDLNKEKLDNLVNGLRSAGDIAGGTLVMGLKAAAAAMAAIGAAAAGIGKWIGDSISVFASFEDSMKQVQATMGLTGEEGEEAFKKLSDAAKDAGANTRFSASEAADALNYLALAGYDADQAVEALPGVLTLAAAGGMDLAQASDLVTDSMAALGLEIDDMGEYMDKMARTSQKSNTNVQQLGEAILVSGGAMKNAGQELDTMNVMLGVLANNGIKGSEGGTHLRNVVMSLTAPTSAAAAELARLGISVSDSSGNIRELNAVFTDLDASLSGMSETDKVNALNNIFNTRDIAAVNALLKGTGEEMNNLYNELANAEGAAVQMSETMESGLAGSVRSLKSAFEGLQIAVGEQFADMAQEVVGNVTGLIRDVTEILNDGFQEGDITAIGEKISAFLVNGINRISDFLPEVMSMVSSMLTELINALIDLLPTLLPPLMDGAIQLLQGIIDAVISNIDPLMEMVVYLVMSVAGFIIDNLPLLLEAAIQIVVSLAQGIADALPELIPAVIEALMLFVETLLSNLDKILEAGMALLQGLVTGIVNALPVLIEMLPRIITSIIEFFTNNIPQLIAMGVELTVQLAVGLIKAIPQLIAQIPKIIAAIVKGIVDCLGSIVEAGAMIIRSLWDGIVSLGSWIIEKVSGLIDSIIGVFTGKKATVEVEVTASTVSADPHEEIREQIQAAADEEVKIERKKSEYIVEAAQSTANSVSEIRSGTAAEAKDAAQEELNLLKWQRDMELITEQDYYTGLERIRDTYYEENTDKWRQYTLELKKLRDNDAKEAARLAESAAKDEEKAAQELAKEKERIAKENANELNKLGNDLTKALKSRYDEQKSALIRALDDEVSAVKSASYEKIRQYDIEYAEKMKLLDDEESYRLSAIQAEIDAIDAKTKAEDQARRQRDYDEKLSELTVKFSQATTTKEQEDIQKEVNRLVESRQREVTLEQRNAQKELLKQQLADEKQRIQEARDALEQSKLEELQIQKDSIKNQFEELMSGESLQAEALKLMLSEQQEDMLSLLETYYPEWKNTGKTFAEMLGMGVAEGKDKIESNLADILSRSNNTQDSGGHSSQYTMPAFEAGQGNNAFGFQSVSFENEFRQCMSGIQGTLENIVQMMKPLAKDIFSMFESPLKGELAGLGSKLDSVIAAIDSMASTVMEPRVIINNNFNGVTAADVPHMVDRENTALLRRMQPSRA